MDRDSKARWAIFVFKVFCSAVIFFTVAFTVFTAGPSLETRYFPAVSKLRIIDMRADSESHAVIMAEFTKLREECEYIGLAWFRGTPDGLFERVPVVLLRQENDRSSPNRPAGLQRAGPWIVHVSPDDLRQNSFAVLQHTCHPFWTTRTEFYP